MDPQTLQEWKDYIDNMSAERVAPALAGANTMTFVRALEREGVSMPQARQVVALFARRAVKDGVLLPTGGAFDLAGLAGAS